MVQKLEDIKGGGGSIKVGTTGTISALMSRELESIKSAPQPLDSESQQDKPKTVPVSVPCSASTPKRQARKSLDEASSSGSSSTVTRKSPETPRRLKSHGKGSHRLPMLRAENVTLERTPSREKTNKKPNIVEVVDIKCGHPDKAWATPITNKLKKLGFSKLSESII